MDREYGVTPELVEEMLKVQRGKCAVCKRRRKLVIDHNHKTGKVRKLLCSGCNFRVGQVENKWDLLLAARDYLDGAA